ncbi:hypothetical protein LT493_29900 [Streptomyces tricolor]|nr:hypothetical protein [Streptomyces tricolor]
MAFLAVPLALLVRSPTCPAGAMIYYSLTDWDGVSFDRTTRASTTTSRSSPRPGAIPGVLRQPLPRGLGRADPAIALYLATCSGFLDLRFAPGLFNSFPSISDQRRRDSASCSVLLPGRRTRLR